MYGWLYILPLWGMAVYADPGISSPWRHVGLVGSTALFLIGWGIARGANTQKYTVKRWPDSKFLGLIEPDYIEAGDRKILCSGLWRVARHFNHRGEGFFSLAIALVFGYFANSWALDVLRLHRRAVHFAPTPGRPVLCGEVRRREVGRVSGPG